MAITFRYRDLGACCLALVAGLAWLHGAWGPALSPLLVIAVAMATGPAQRYLASMSYFLAGSCGLPEGAATFFGNGHPVLGWILWIASAALLSLPWVWAKNAWGMVAAIALDAIPPLGLFGWLSPLTAAGVLFPGAGCSGLGITIILYWIFGTYAAGREDDLLIRAMGLSSIVIMSMTANLLFISHEPPAVPQGWVGISTHVGLVPENPFAAVERNAAWIADAAAHTASAHVVVLPETIAGDWLPGTAAQIQAAIPAGQTWLVGTSAAMPNGERADALIAVGQNASSTALFIAPFPVPVSMWHPWRRGGYVADWWEPVREVAGHRAWAAICYDQLLPWVWFEALAQHPDAVLAASNVWWAKGTNIPAIEVATTAAWGRLMGVPVVFATNR